MDGGEFIYYLFFMKTERVDKKTILLSAALALFLLPLVSLGALGEKEPSPSPAGPDYYDPAFLEAALEGQADEFLLIDVRTPAEYQAGHIPGAVLNPVAEIGTRLPEVAKDFPLVVYCRSGNRSAQAAGILKQAGYTNVTDFGGINRWRGPLAFPEKP